MIYSNAMLIYVLEYKNIFMSKEAIMKNIDIVKDALINGAEITSGNACSAELSLPAQGGGLALPQLINCTERYLTFFIEALEEHSVTMNLFVYSKADPEGAPCFNVRFGVMPKVRTLICLDLCWLDAHILFPESTEGQLKIVCHGGRIERDEIDHITLTNFPCFHDIALHLSDLTLTDKRPEYYSLPDLKLIDEMGQYKKKDWPQKIHSISKLSDSLNNAVDTLPDEYSISDWDEYGGWKRKRLTEGTGYFSKIKQDGRWWLINPLGNAFFSMGPDCVVSRSDCRIDGIEKFMDWLPERNDPEFSSMYRTQDWPSDDTERRRKCTLFSFEQANLYRAFGENWYDKWTSLMSRQLKQNGMNTLGNWSDQRLFGKIKQPYVTMLEHFPTTEQLIFRDFPDVFSEEYQRNADVCAQSLNSRKEDPYMIGYFLRNEPAWAFVDNLVIADEVLYNPAETVCKDELINFLHEKYNTVEALSSAWNYSFSSFNDLYKPIRHASKLSEASLKDMRAFSRRMLDAYVSIPSKACRAVDPNHMNLGMRWAWISDADVVTGWENFDVFSINCYAMDPTSALDNVCSLGVDLPVMIGEFHFGALDVGLTATGLKAVKTQEDRGTAYRFYCERAAAHPNGVGCHYFQCYDQFALGRFDGENYNIGLFDICSQPYKEMMDAIRVCSENIYEVADGHRLPYDKQAQTIPMIAY